MTDATTTLTMALPPDRHAQLQALAIKRGRTVDQIVEHALTQYLDRPVRGRPQGGGTPPYGFRWADGILQPVEAEQALIRAIGELRRHGLTLRAIAESLNGCGQLRRGGGRWRGEQVRRVLGEGLKKGSGDDG